MKRIDVLKDIEQILVQKAYETGHISHRADGDWQKQADGSWIPYKGQSSKPAPQAQESTENTKYGEITEEDLAETPNDTIYSTEDITTTIIDGEDAYEIAGTPIIAVKDPTGKWQVMDGDKIVADGLNTALAHETMVKTMNDKHGEITEEDLKGSNTTDTSNIDTKEKKRDVQNKIDGVFKLRDEDTKKMLGIRRDDSKEHGYDGEIRFYADGNRNIKPASDRKEFDKVVQYYLDKAGLEDTPFNHKVAHKYIVGYAKNNGLIGDYYWSKVLYPNGYGSDDENVEKSAVRDMRSTPTVKNMGF